MPLGLLAFDAISMPVLTIIRGRSDPGCCVIHSYPDAAKPHSSIKVVSRVEPSIAWPALAEIVQRSSTSCFNQRATRQARSYRFSN